MTNATASSNTYLDPLRGNARFEKNVLYLPSNCRLAATTPAGRVWEANVKAEVSACGDDCRHIDLGVLRTLNVK